MKYALGAPSVGRGAIPFAFKGELAESRRVDLLPLNLWLQRHPVRVENIEIMSALPSPAQADKQIFGKSGPVTRGKAARLRSILWFMTRITVTCACLWRVGRMVDVQALRTILTTVSMPLLSLSFVFFLLMAVLWGIALVGRVSGHRPLRTTRRTDIDVLDWLGAEPDHAVSGGRYRTSLAFGATGISVALDR